MPTRYVVREGKLYCGDAKTVQWKRNGRVDTLIYLRQELKFIKDVDLPDGFYRYRRDKLVRIPDEWVGHTVHNQTKRKRQPIKRRTRKEK